MRFARRFAMLLVVSTLSLSACVAPTTQLGALSPETVKSEQLKQQQLTLQTAIKQQQRLEDLTYPLLKAAVPLCGPAVTVRSGLRFTNLQAYTKEWIPAARANGLTDTLTIIGVTRGSGAERAGIKPGDRLLTVAGGSIPAGRNALTVAGKRFTSFTQASFTNPVAPERKPKPPADLAVGPNGTLPLTVLRDSTPLQLEVPVDTVCAFDVVAQRDETLNAWADGENIVITTAMMRFASDDEALRTILGHELAHNAMRHIDAKKKNATVGALFGAILDVAAASQGVNTGGDFANQGAAIGAMTFSQDFEREADVVGLYILARAGLPIETAPNIWRTMATESPGSIKYATSHPTTAERFVRLEETIKDIERKRAAGEPLLPDQKAK